MKGGVLEFDSIAERGTICSLGYQKVLHENYFGAKDASRAVPYAFRLGDGTNAVRTATGTLSYVGAADASCSTRPIALSGAGRLRNASACRLDWAGVTSLDCLLVGGGGGGGGQIGGGGGGGGVVHRQGVFLPAGDYDITIGVGGSAGDGSHAGGKGGDTMLRQLPPDSAKGIRLDSVETMAATWLNTGVVPDARGRIEMKFRILAAAGYSGSNNHTIFCARGETTQTSTFTLFDLDGKWRADFANANGTETGTATVGTDYEIIFSPTDGLKLVGGSKVCDLPNPASDFTVGGPLVLFGSYTGAVNAQTVIGNQANIRIYSLRLTDRNGQEQLNLVPWRDLNGVVGFYDSVGNRFLAPMVGELKGNDTAADDEGLLSFVAYGGGGGDEWDQQRPQGANFGSTGGGAQNRNAKTGLGAAVFPTPGQGNYGGNGDDRCGGGGGGAGEAGGYVNLSDSLADGNFGGKGGDGLACEITGERVWYGAGGGGGAYNLPFNLFGRGGHGGGGDGHSDSFSGFSHNGADGFGGGGGGGSNSNATGGRGGAGTVIVRFTPASVKRTMPVLGCEAVTAGNGTVAFRARVIATGRAAAGRLLFRYGADRNYPDHETVLSEAICVGAWDFEVGSLRSLQPYYGRLRLELPTGESAETEPFSFTTRICDDAAIDVGAPQLTEVTMISNHASRVVFTGRAQGENLELTVFAGASERVMTASPCTVVWDEAAADGTRGFIATAATELPFATWCVAAVQATNANGVDRSDLVAFETPGEQALTVTAVSPSTSL